MSEAIELDAGWKEIDVTITFDGIKREFFIRELDGHSRDLVLTNGSKRFADNKIKTFEGHQSFLLSKTLYDKDTGKLVDEKTIQSWPSRIQKVLYEKSEELSALFPKKEDGDEGKND